MFGRPVPQKIVKEKGKPVRYWGARAIFHPHTRYPIDIVPDRQSCECADGLGGKPLVDWLNNVAMPALKKMPEFERLSSDSDTVVEFKQGCFTLQCSPNSSYGYLYIGAWEYWANGCRYEQEKPDFTAKWSNLSIPIPEVGKTIYAYLNAEWKGVVTGYFVEHGYQGVELDCSNGKTPEYFKRQGEDPNRVLMFGVDITKVV